MSEADSIIAESDDIVTLGMDSKLFKFYEYLVSHNFNAGKAYQDMVRDTEGREIKITSARVTGHYYLKRLMETNKGAVVRSFAEQYGLDDNKYFTQLRDGLEADRWNDFTGEREPDHKTRKGYHDKLGQMLGYEVSGKGIEVSSSDGDGKHITVRVLDFE
jgi:hypothetical protein